MKLLKQIVKEFWLPLVLSILWVIYNIYGGNNEGQWSIQRVVNLFGTTFFLLSWLTGQYHRIKKQTKVEDSFDAIETRFKELLGQLESKTNEMIGHISGGNSFPWLQIGQINHSSDTGVLVVIHEGEHPLYDVNAQIVDLVKFEQIKQNLSLENRNFADTDIYVGNMIPLHARMLRQWKIESCPEQSYNIFFTARNGSFTQLLRLKKINGTWISATIVKKNDEVLHEEVHENFPRDLDGKICWE